MPNEKSVQISVFSKARFGCLSGGEQFVRVVVHSTELQTLHLSIHFIDYAVLFVCTYFIGLRST